MGAIAPKDDFAARLWITAAALSSLRPLQCKRWENRVQFENAQSYPLSVRDETHAVPPANTDSYYILKMPI